MCVRLQVWANMSVSERESERVRERERSWSLSVLGGFVHKMFVSGQRLSVKLLER